MEEGEAGGHSSVCSVPLRLPGSPVEMFHQQDLTQVQEQEVVTQNRATVAQDTFRFKLEFQGI